MVFEGEENYLFTASQLEEIKKAMIILEESDFLGGFCSGNCEFMVSYDIELIIDGRAVKKICKECGRDVD